MNNKYIYIYMFIIINDLLFLADRNLKKLKCRAKDHKSCPPTPGIEYKFNKFAKN